MLPYEECPEHFSLVLRPCPAKEGSFGRGRGSLFYVKTLGLDFQHLSGRPTCL